MDVKTKYNRYTIDESGSVYSNITNKYLKASVTYQGYAQMTLFDNNKKRQRMYLHRLIAETFLDNIGNLPAINHIDGNKLNNNVSNLEWCTTLQNNMHAISTGLKVMPNKDEHYKATAVNQIDKLTGCIINTFSSIVEAAEHIANPVSGMSGISKCITNKQETSGGFKWEKA